MRTTDASAEKSTLRAPREAPGREAVPPLLTAHAKSTSTSGLIAATTVLLRYRRMVVLCIVVMTILMTTLALIAPPTFTSSSAFMAHVSGGSLSGLSNLATQLGVSVGKEDPTESPDFYAEVLKSRDLLTTLAKDHYDASMPEGKVSGTIADVLRIRKPTEALRLEAALKQLGQMIFVKITRQTGIVHVTVKTPSADLSQQLNVRLLAALDDFNSRLRQRQASAEEKFLDERERDAQAAYQAAEARVVDFLQSNRNYGSSPTLAHEYSRLTREAGDQLDVVTSLSKARSQARIEAARNTPVITVLDNPNVPLRRDGRGLVRAVLLAVLLGGLIGIVLAFIANSFSDVEEGEDIRQFAQLRAEALQDLRHPLRALLPRRTLESAGG